MTFLTKIMIATMVLTVILSAVITRGCHRLGELAVVALEAEKDYCERHGGEYFNAKCHYPPGVQK